VISRWMKWLAAPALGLILASCGTSTQMMERWQEPTYQPIQASKVVVIGIGENARRVSIFEDIMGQKFASRKIDVVKGTSILPRDSVDIETFKMIIHDTGAQLVITARLVGIENETSYVPGTTSYVPAPSYYGMYGYYYSSYATMSTPGYYTSYKVYKVESNVYDVKQEKLVWSGESHTTDPQNAEDGIDSFGNTLIDELLRAKMIK